MKKLVSVIIANCLLFTTVVPSYVYAKEKFYLRAPHSEEIDKAIQEPDSEIIEKARKVAAMGVEGAEYIDWAIASLDQIIARDGVLIEQAKELKKKLWNETILKPLKSALGEYDMRFIAESKPTAANPKPRARKFTPKHAYEMARAIGTKHFKAGDTVCVFGDARSSRDVLMSESIRGLQEQGVNVIYSNEIVPSPVVKWIADMFRIPSIQISGSHNPADENGIKIRLRVNGEGPVTELFGGELLKTGDIVENGQYRSLLDKSVKPGSIVKIGEALNEQELDEKYKDKPELRDFLRRLGSGVEPLSIDKNGQLVKGKKKEYGVLALYKNMLVDEFAKNYQGYLNKGIVPYIYAETGNGVMGPVLEDVFKRIGLKENKDFEFVQRQDGSDGRKPMGDPPVIADTLETEKYLRPLRDAIKKHTENPVKNKKPAIGIAFDGDGDRLEIVIYDSETGEGIPVTPERLMILGYRDYALKYAYEWIKNGEKMLVPVDVRGSSVVSEMLEKVAQEVREKYKNQFSEQQLKKFGIIGEYIPTGYPYNTKYAEGVGIIYTNVLMDEKGNKIGEKQVTVGKNIKGVQRVCPVNCEASGHAYWALMIGTERGDIPNDDGLYSALYYLLMDAKMRNGEDGKFESISDAVSPENMVKYPVTPDIRLVAVKDSEKFKISEKIAMEIIPILIKKYNKKVKINNASGWRLDFEDGGFILVRASNTSAKISFKAEMKTAEELLVMAQELDELLVKYQEGEKTEIIGDDWKNEIQKILVAFIKEKEEKEVKGKYEDEDGKRAWDSILKNYKKGNELISSKVDKKDWDFKDLSKLTAEQKIKLIGDLEDLRASHWIPQETIEKLKSVSIETDTYYQRIAQAARAEFKRVIAQLETELKKEREKGVDGTIASLKETMGSRLFSFVTIPVVAIFYARGFVINRAQLILSHASLGHDPILDFVAGLKAEYPTMAPVYLGLVTLVLAVSSYILYKVQTDDNFLKDFKPLKNLEKSMDLFAHSI